jgi:hypothetical protein
MKLILVISSILITITTIATKITTPKKIAQELKAELESMEQTYQKEETLKSIIYQKDQQTNFYLDTFKIRIRPFATFKIPGIVSLRVRPRFAFIWGRKLPPGWEKYSK